MSQAFESFVRAVWLTAIMALDRLDRLEHEDPDEGAPPP